MPYKDPEAQRRYQREWVNRRRAEASAGASCVDCGAIENLELDHLDRDRKVSHRIWSWSEARRAEEIAKCVWRCRPCHIERHAEERRRHGLGGYRRGCRCEVCAVAKRESNRRYAENKKRRGPESNGPERLCRPLPNHSATAPEAPEAIELLEEAA